MNDLGLKNRFKHEIRTPTVTFTAIGALGLVLDRFGWRYGKPLAFIGFMLAAGGVGIALGDVTRENDEPWEWDGIYRACRKPNGKFWGLVLSHLPQLLLALWLAEQGLADADRLRRRA